MKKIYLLGFFALAQCMPIGAQQANLLPEHTQTNPWRYLEHQLIKRPSEVVKSCFDRKFNLGASVLAWTSAAISCASQWYFDQQHTKAQNTFLLNYDYDEIDQQEIDQYEAYGNTASNFFRATCITSCLITLWALYHNCFTMVASAEKEQLSKLLDNWEHVRQYVPEDLHEVFQAAVTLRATNPAEFDKQAPEFIKTLKHEIQARVNDPDFVNNNQLNAQLEQMINSLPSKNAVYEESA